MKMTGEIGPDSMLSFSSISLIFLRLNLVLKGTYISELSVRRQIPSWIPRMTGYTFRCEEICRRKWTSYLGRTSCSAKGRPYSKFKILDRGLTVLTDQNLISQWPTCVGFSAHVFKQQVSFQFSEQQPCLCWGQQCGVRERQTVRRRARVRWEYFGYFRICSVQPYILDSRS